MPAFRVRSRETAGSGENLDLLARGHCGHRLRSGRHLRGTPARPKPERYSRLTVIGRLTDECLYIAYRPGGPRLELRLARRRQTTNASPSSL